MLRLGGTASPDHIEAFEALVIIFRKRGIDMDWVLYSDYDPMVAAFVSGEIDMAWNGPLSYVKIRRLIDEPCRVIAMRNVDVDYVTHFITHDDSPIQSVADLRGKRFAFGDRGSVQAGLLPYHFLKESGIDPSSDLAGFTFYDERPGGSTSDEDDVVERVAYGEYDAGAVSGQTLKALEKRTDTPETRGLRVLWSSPPYSHCCFTLRSDVDPALTQQIESAFLSADSGDPDGRALLAAEGCDAIVVGRLDGWDLIEKAAEREGLI
jgi:phosphate/phosphite/phosphonate ABC transporter binding protein